MAGMAAAPKTNYWDTLNLRGKPDDTTKTPNVPTSQDGQPERSLISMIEMPFQKAAVIASSVYTKLFIFSVVLVVAGSHVTIGMNGCRGVLEISQQFFGGENEGGGAVFAGMQSLDSSTGKFSNVSGLETWDGFLTAAGFDGDDMDQVESFVAEYQTTNPLVCMHESRGARIVLQVLSIMLATIFTMSTLFLGMQELRVMVNYGASRANVSSFISTLVFGIISAVNCVMLYFLVTDLYLPADEITRSHHRRSAANLFVMVIFSGAGAGLVAIGWVLNTVMSVGWVRKLLGTNYYKYLPKYLVSGSYVGVQEGDVGAHPLPIVSSMRTDQAFTLCLYASMFIMAYLGWTIKTHHVDDTRPECTDCYITGRSGVLGFLNAGGNQLTPSGEQSVDLTEALLGTWRVVYSGQGDTPWTIRHALSHFSAGAQALIYVSGIVSLINIVFIIASIFKKETQSHDPNDAVVYLHREQRIPQLIVGLAAIFVNMGFPVFVHDIIYINQNVGENEHYDAIGRAEGTKAYIAMSGVVGLLVFGVMAVIEMFSPTAMRIDPGASNQTDDDSKKTA